MNGNVNGKTVCVRVKQSADIKTTRNLLTLEYRFVKYALAQSSTEYFVPLLTITSRNNSFSNNFYSLLRILSIWSKSYLSGFTLELFGFILFIGASTTTVNKTDLTLIHFWEYYQYELIWTWINYAYFYACPVLHLNFFIFKKFILLLSYFGSSTNTDLDPLLIFRWEKKNMWPQTVNTLLMIWLDLSFGEWITGCVF